MYKFNELVVGIKAEIQHTITDDDLRHFVELTGDDNLLHTDPNFASKTSFKKPVVHGMLGASFISTIIGTKLPGNGALWFSQNLEFHYPVRIGDTITVRAEIIKKDERSRIIELLTDIYNQNRLKVTSGIAKVKIVEPEPEEPLNIPTQPHKKVALVVGGSGGIGSAVSLALASEGFDIALHYFNNKNSAILTIEKIKNLNRNSKIFFADIQKLDSVNEMIESVIRYFGCISVLVNCSSIKINSIKFTELRWKDLKDQLDNQIKGTFNLVRTILPFMEKEKYGKIITINSQALDSPSSDWLPYITAKGALLGFTRALAFDLAPKGILVNSVSPGMTNTDLISDIPERIRLVTAARTPLKRLAQPEDIAKAVSFLASEKSDFLCGETIRVNGGQIMI